MRQFPQIAPEEDPAGKLADMIVNTKYEDVPEDVIEKTKQIILDNIAVTIAGSDWLVAPGIAKMVNEWGGEPTGKVLIHGFDVPAHNAAFANGVISRSIDMGDVHDNGSHIYENVVPTLLSCINMDGKVRSGKDFLMATIVGAETAMRACAAIALTSHTALGIPGEWQFTLGAAGAVARLRELSVDEAWNTLGICYSVHSMAELQKYTEGTQMARVQHCFASDTAVKASSMVKLGVNGPKAIFMGNGGILRHLPYDDFDETWVDGHGLGKEWYAVETSLKPYSCCKYVQSWIYGTVLLKKEYGFDISDIESIHLIGSEGARMVVEPHDLKWNPTTTGEAAFSAAYAVATAALNGTVFLGDLSDEAINGIPEKRELMQKITIDIDPTIETMFDGFTTEITLKDGRTISKTAPFVLGHPNNPMTWEDIEEKFWNCVPFCATDIPREKFERVIELVKNLENVEDMNEVLECLVP